MQEDCEGCEKEWGSQKDHACLMQEKTKKDITNVINEIFQSIHYNEFLVVLSQSAQKRSIAVKRPYEMFHHVKMIKEDELKKNILTEYEFA